MKKYLVFSLILLSNTCFADQLLNTYHIKRVFAEGTAQAGFYTAEALPECKWGIMYIDLSNPTGKVLMSIALTAKATNQVIKRMDYTVSPVSTC